MMEKAFGSWIEAEVVSANVSATLDALNRIGIPLYHIQQMDELTARICCRRKDYGKIRKKIESRGDSLRILRKSGPYWTLNGMKKRPVLLVGCIFLLMLILYLPTRIYFINVEGNETVPARQILEAAQKCGISFGASRRAVRSEKVKNALLAELPQLKWAGVNTSGCTATISVRERIPDEGEAPKKQVGNVVAIRDGFVVSATSTSGTLLCKPGQTVMEGQILISGYTDCGICIQADKAEGEIFAQTDRDISMLLPLNALERTDRSGVQRKISLCIGKKRINLWKDSGIWDVTCGRIYKEYYITLPGDFCLPIALAVETYSKDAVRSVSIAHSEAEAMMTGYAESYLQNQMVAGTILSGKQTVTEETGYYCFRGSYVCVEMIGKEQGEQIGETNGESD